MAFKQKITLLDSALVQRHVTNITVTPTEEHKLSSFDEQLDVGV